MRILIDVDEVCADLMSEWLARYNADWHDALCPGDITDWDMTRFVRPGCGKKIYWYLHDDDLYDCVNPVDGALESIAKLRHDGHSIGYLTSTNPYQIGQKAKWLRTHGFLEHGDFIGLVPRADTLRPDKGVVVADMLIDDGIHNLDAFLVRGRFGILFDAPHNRADTRHMRARGWDEVLGLVEVCAEKLEAKASE